MLVSVERREKCSDAKKTVFSVESRTKRIGQKL